MAYGMAYTGKKKQKPVRYTYILVIMSKMVNTMANKMVNKIVNKVVNKQCGMYKETF